ncbi:GNAT family acetyltransferase [Frankia canadensis]|uniref:GNAT family acetyltransferase n=1 Tax=Frankia canadensis TaxID=1836972 RepID=A0A2I2KVS3_9ACTN|nr:GNAT family N-acetyltransferase [Frankia canadensis]SNQ49755.1 GNAT family acetyltransferase [Frankia canadensis]SOU57045.1 GNAT family acetyltransferase [Frankia canadensis]
MEANQEGGAVIRAAQARDEAEWRRLWEGYNRFYEVDIPTETTAMTWQRILDPQGELLGRMAVRGSEAVGFSVSVTHATSWATSRACYLEDLFVDPGSRGTGIGRSLIVDLLDLTARSGWSSLYWHTRSDNPARRLYDEFVPADDFVRYRVHVPLAPPAAKAIGPKTRPCIS